MTVPLPSLGDTNWGDWAEYVHNRATAHTHGVADLTATGTRSSSTYLRGDGTWAAPTGTSNVLNVRDYGATGNGTTNDAPAVNAAVAAAAAAGGGIIHFPPGTYQLATAVTVATRGITFAGSGPGSTLRNGNNLEALVVTGDYFTLRDLTVAVTDQARTNYPVRITGAHPVIERAAFEGTDGSRRAGLFLIGGSMAVVHNCVFNHACIRVETWDVKIDKTYIWAMSCDFGVGIYGGVGNATLTNVDVVPPLQSNANGIAGIVVGPGSLNVKMTDIYLDGNPNLVVRKGIHVGDGAGAILMQNINANRMDADCIVLDSCYNVTINGYSGYGNNASGNGAREIFITKTGAQPTEGVTLTNIHCLHTASLSGTLGPAVQVNTAAVAADQVSIENFIIKHPNSGAGGYSVPEVVADNPGGTSLYGRASRSSYFVVGSAPLSAAAGDVTITLSSGYALAYQPLPADIQIQFQGVVPGTYRLQFINPNQIYIPFSEPLTGAGTIHWKVSLRR